MRGLAKKIRVCKNCGRQIPSGVISCSICGTGEELTTPHYATTDTPLQEFSHKGGTRKLEGIYYPGLYSQPRSLEGLDKSALLSILYNPKKAFKSLYLSANLKGAVALLAVVSILVGTWSILWIHVFNQSEILWIHVFYQSESPTALEWFQAVELMSSTFVSLGLLAILGAFFLRKASRGRGDYRSSFILVAYVGPWVAAFGACIGFLSWESSSSLNVYFAFAGAILVWLLWVWGTALSVANDVSVGQGVSAVFVAPIAVGIILLFERWVISGGPWESVTTVMVPLIAVFFVLLVLKMKPWSRALSR